MLLLLLPRVSSRFHFISDFVMRTRRPTTLLKSVLHFPCTGTGKYTNSPRLSLHRILEKTNILFNTEKQKKLLRKTLKAQGFKRNGGPYGYLMKTYLRLNVQAKIEVVVEVKAGGEGRGYVLLLSRLLTSRMLFQDVKEVKTALE